jgi:hypothetical protein
MQMSCPEYLIIESSSSQRTHTQSRRLVTDKLTQGLTIIVELLIIAAIVYWKYYS